ncbi:MAG: cupin domain-containing protein [Myxococcales bacterium]|nr:cupin domain-containing protein [Myxococcales bacterium]
MSAPRVLSASETFASLDAAGGVQTHDVSPEFWSQLASGERVLPGPYLMSFGSSSGDWPHWEMHPSGEEIVMLIAGSGDLLLRLPDGDRCLSLGQAGEYVVIPRGTWHTYRKAKGEGATLLFITTGEGTTRSEDPPRPAT